MDGLSPKKKILAAGETIMAEAGLNARISDIAARAGVSDSVLYHYFKNKEDLLFSIAEDRLRDLREAMEEQLLGLSDPMSRLRKLFFFRLHYLMKNKDYGNLLMFECRSNMAFYSHPAFAQARWFMSLLGQILKDGMEKGAFRNDLNVWLVRDAVFGLLDLTNIAMLLDRKTESAGKAEELFGLIEPMVTGGTEARTPEPDKRQRILRAAENLFAEKGFASATIQAIAAAAGVGDGTVYDYFKNKEDVLFSVLAGGFQLSERRKGFQDHLRNSDDPGKEPGGLEKLERFIRRFFQIGLTQPAFARIFIIHGIFNRPFYGSPAHQSFERFMENLDRCIDACRREKTVRSDIDPGAVRLLVIGAFSHLTLRWQISEKKTNLDKAGEINAMTELVIRSVSTR